MHVAPGWFTAQINGLFGVQMSLPAEPSKEPHAAAELPQGESLREMMSERRDSWETPQTTVSPQLYHYQFHLHRGRTPLWELRRPPWVRRLDCPEVRRNVFRLAQGPPACPARRPSQGARMLQDMQEDCRGNPPAVAKERRSWHRRQPTISDR